MGCFSAPTTKVEAAPTLTADQQKYIKQIGNFLMPMIGQAGPSYEGRRVAPLNPLEVTTLNAGINQGMSSTKNLLTGDWMQPITAQSQNLWNKTIMPSIMNLQSGMDSANSGGTTQALMQGGQDLATQLAAALAPLTIQSSAQGMANLGSLYNLGQAQQQQTQNELSAAQQQWQEQQPIYNPVLSQLGLLFGNQTENIASQVPAGMGYSALSGAASGLGSILGML